MATRLDTFPLMFAEVVWILLVVDVDTTLIVDTVVATDVVCIEVITLFNDDEDEIEGTPDEVDELEGHKHGG